MRKRERKRKRMYTHNYFETVFLSVIGPMLSVYVCDFPRASNLFVLERVLNCREFSEDYCGISIIRYHERCSENLIID